MNASVAYEKRDWGSGTLHCRRNNGLAPTGRLVTRRLSNREATRAWFVGDSVKAY